ncbi:hypothetical protein D3C80_1905210 [compost metagenome]
MYELSAALVVELVSYQRYALSMVVVIPVGEGVLQVLNLGLGLGGGPLRARLGVCAGEPGQQQ